MNESIRIPKRTIIALGCIKGFGPVITKKICDFFIYYGLSPEDPEDFMYAINEMKETGIGGKKVEELPQSVICQAFEQAEWILDKNDDIGIKIVTRYDCNFPKRLLRVFDDKGSISEPTLLYYKGDLSVLDMPSVAMIGTRDPTQDGNVAGCYFSGIFASKGFNIISGLAQGCDTSCHQGALSANGVTTAILAHGLDIIFPPQNESLAENILSQGGLLLSEYPVGTHVSKSSLIKRDRIQAGLAQATIVIQAGKSGGSMHAANATLMSNKPLYVVKYKDMAHAKVEGNKELLKLGAHVITAENANIVADTLIGREISEPIVDTLF